MASKSNHTPAVARIAPGVFTVTGRKGDVYMVKRGQGCSCPAGRHGRRCYHRAAVVAFCALSPVSAPSEQVEFLAALGVAA
jgi:uncharacterized Zn finger protein